VEQEEAAAIETRRRTIVVVAVIVGVVAVVVAAYLRYVGESRPGVLTPHGFYGFSDQSAYLTSARRLAHFAMPRNNREYRYGLGYPILGAVFIKLGFNGDPFAPVDALAYGATAALTFVLGTRLSPFKSTRGAVMFGIACAFVAMFVTPLPNLAAVPWNSNIVVALGTLVLVLATSEREVTMPRAIAIGVALGWIFSTRYADAIFLGVVTIPLLIRCTPIERARLIIGGGGAALVIVGLVLASQWYVFGSPFTTPYHYHTRNDNQVSSDDQSLSEYKLGSVPRHFFGAFITGEDNHGHRQVHQHPIVQDFPLLVAMPLGAWVVGRRRSPTRAIWMTAFGASIAGSIFYLSFAAGGGGDLKFGNARYWAPFYPLWAVFGVVGIVWVADLVVRKVARTTAAESDVAEPIG
jgi:hypothetical protein